MTEAAIPLAFLAGVLSVTSPCVLPILPALLAGSTGHRLKPVAIVAGSIVTFTLMGGAFAAAGVVFGTNRILLRGVFAFVIMLFGLVLVDPYAEAVFTSAARRVPDSVGVDVSPDESLGGAFLLGASLGIVWIPCIGPILGPILALVTFQGNVTGGSMLLFVYGLGLAVPLLAIAYGGKSVAARVRWVGQHNEVFRRIAGVVLIGTGIAVLFGVDTLVVNRLYPHFPNLQELLTPR